MILGRMFSESAADHVADRAQGKEVGDSVQLATLKMVHRLRISVVSALRHWGHYSQFFRFAFVVAI